MKVIVCSFVSELSDRALWLYQQRQWTRQELLLVALGLLVLLLFALRRRRRKAVRTIYPEHFADRSSVIGVQLSGQRRSHRAFADSRNTLATRVSSKHGKPLKAGKAAKRQQESGEHARKPQWEIVKPRQSGDGSKTKVARLAVANRHVRLEAAEDVRTKGRSEPRPADAMVPKEQLKPRPMESKRADGAISQHVGEMTAANEKLRREAEEHRQAQERFEQKLAELTAANKQLQHEVAELKNAGSKRRVYTYEDEHRVADGIKQKLCRKCGEWKAESEYHKNASRSDGLARWCKICKTGAARRSRERRRTPNS